MTGVILTSKCQKVESAYRENSLWVWATEGVWVPRERTLGRPKACAQIPKQAHSLLFASHTFISNSVYRQIFSPFYRWRNWVEMKASCIVIQVAGITCVENTGEFAHTISILRGCSYKPWLDLLVPGVSIASFSSYSLPPSLSPSFPSFLPFFLFRA